MQRCPFSNGEPSVVGMMDMLWAQTSTSCQPCIAIALSVYPNLIWVYWVYNPLTQYEYGYKHGWFFLLVFCRTQTTWLNR